MSNIITAIILCLATSHVSMATDAFYDLRGHNHCSAVATDSSKVDLLCELSLSSDLPEGCSNKSVAGVSWFFSSSISRHEITDGKKYGLWNEVKDDNVSSVLRIRTIEGIDAGFYTCSLSCPGIGSGTVDRSRVPNKYIELCVRDDATGLIECNQGSSQDSCTHVFANGECDEHCDSEEQLFDGGDCDPYRYDPCLGSIVAECQRGYQDNNCNTNCSAPQCGFDGGDCLKGVQLADRETLGVVIPAHMSADDIGYLSQQLSMMLSTLVWLHGGHVPWKVTDSKELQITYLNAEVFQASGTDLVMLEYQLVPQSCPTKDGMCFHRVPNAAKYVSHKMNTNSSTVSTPIAAIGIKNPVDACTKRVDSPTQPTRSEDYAGQYNKPVETTTTKTNELLSVGAIVGIVLCTIALVMLIVGILLAWRYQRIVKARRKSEAKQKESDVKAYIDNIPPHFDSVGRSSSPQSHVSSLAQSCTSKDNIIPRSRLRSYVIDDEQV